VICLDVPQLSDSNVIAFLLIAAVMLLAALAFVLIPLLRAPSPDRANLSDAASNAAIFRAQKREIEADFAQSLIGVDERDRALRELEMRVVAEIAPDAPLDAATRTGAQRATWMVAIFAAIAFPITAVLVYASLGTPQVISGGAAAIATAKGPPANGNNPGNAELPMSDKQILAMVDALAQKMEQNPGDVKGWTLLARSQNALGRFADAAKAYERAIALEPKDAQLYADYADAAVMAQEGKFEGKPYTLINQALKLDSTNLKALALAGTAEMRMGNKDASLKHWEKIKSLVAKDSDDYREVESIIAEVKSGTPGTPPPRAVPANPPAAQAATPATASNASITGQINLAPSLTEKIAPGDTLFVFARALSGPKMPLAVMRVPAPKSWPFKFELNDSMAMAPGMNLSAFPEVTIEARISKSGGAQPLPGDLAGQSAPTKPGASNVAVTISRVVP
jgi:cytochrome c-type biogenesis protein CcmH